MTIQRLDNVLIVVEDLEAAKAFFGALVFPPVLNLMTEDGSQQASAAFDCFALGRSDARPLKLLRASLRWLADVDATWPAIQILSLATPHPDVMWADQTWLPDAIREEVVATFRWSMDEVELLLGAPTGEMWGRGDLGQCVYMLLVADPRHEALLEHVASTATDDEVASSAASMRVALAGEKGLSTLARLTAANPALKQNGLFAELLATLEEHGHVSMF